MNSEGIPNTKVEPELKAGPFRRANCRGVYYRIKSTRETFTVDSFGKAMESFWKTIKPANEWDESKKIRGAVVCNPQDAEVHDFHVHFVWEIGDVDVKFDIGYHREAKKEKKERVEEHEPYAEQFMAWFKNFFLSDTVQSDVEASFMYPGRKSRFPLPVTLSIPGMDSESQIEGIFVSFPSRPAGIERAILMQGDPGKLLVQLWAEERINFSDFDVTQELIRLGGFAESISEGEKND